MQKTRLADERGSALPLMAITLGGVVLALTVLVVQTQVQVRTARAQWAADGAALAAAADAVAGSADGGPVARRSASAVAGANGARLISIEIIEQRSIDPPTSDSSQPGIDESTPISPTVVVEVELAGVRARAAAARFAVVEP